MRLIRWFADLHWINKVLFLFWGVVIFSGSSLVHAAANPADWAKSAHQPAEEVRLMEMQPGYVDFLRFPTHARITGMSHKTGNAHGVDGVIFDAGDGTYCILAVEDPNGYVMDSSMQSPQAAICFAAALQNPTVQAFIHRWETAGKKVSPVWANK